MKPLLHTILISIILLFCFGGFYHFSLGMGLQHHLTISAHRESKPDLIPTPEMVEIMSAGHSLTYADFLWISLIQHIGANILTQEYLTFSTEFLNTLTQVHTRFGPAYEWALLLLPVPQNSHLIYDEKEKSQLQKPLEIALR